MESDMGQNENKKTERSDELVELMTSVEALEAENVELKDVNEKLVADNKVALEKATNAEALEAKVSAMETELKDANAATEKVKAELKELGEKSKDVAKLVQYEKALEVEREKSFRSEKDRQEAVTLKSEAERKAAKLEKQVSSLTRLVDEDKALPGQYIIMENIKENGKALGAIGTVYKGPNAQKLEKSGSIKLKV